MILEKIKSEGLAHNSYLLGSKNEAAVIDPRRDCEIYTEYVQQNNLRIKYIFETHRNEDYVIGSLDLQHKTNAEIFHGSALKFAYGKPVKEKDRFSLGMMELGILETPGHTDESISLTLKVKDTEEVSMVFTGDTLFAGDTGRIDLYGETEKHRLAAAMHDSLQLKLLTLKDGVIVCPAHGKGSVCGKEISDLEYTSIGYEKQTNPQLSLQKDKFIQMKIHEHHYRPPYFKHMEQLNQNGAPLLHTLPVLHPVSAETLHQFSTNTVQIVDIRSPASFASGHIPGSIHLWRTGLPVFAGWFLDYNTPIILIDDFNLNLETVVRQLLRFGYTDIAGYLSEGFSSWYKQNQRFEQVTVWSPAEVQQHQKDTSVFLLDVREKEDRKKQGHIANSTHIYVGDISNQLSQIPSDKNVVIYCDSGFKTSIASSILKRNQYPTVTNMLGGFMAWKKAELPIEHEEEI
jgi:hydroxyacylglutathione hydrolase